MQADYHFLGYLWTNGIHRGISSFSQINEEQK